MDNSVCYFAVREGMGYTLLDSRTAATSGHFSTQGAALRYAEKRIEADRELAEAVRWMDGWTL